MDLWFPVSITFFVSLLAIKVINPIAVKTGLVDLPCARKAHEGHIPLIGGIAIYLSVLITSILFIKYSRDLNLYLVASALVLFLGALDDRYQLSVRVRLVAQVLVASLVIFGTEIYLHSLGFILGSIELKLGVFGVLLTIIAIIAGINAINMIDGMDGLAGALSLVAFAALAFLLSRVTNAWSLLPALFIAALLGYLVFNLRLHSSFTKIFMGDSGSMIMGFLVALLTIYFLQSNERSSNVLLQHIDAMLFSFVVIIIPVVDTLRVVLLRVFILKRSPLAADRNHIHHALLDIGLNHWQATLCLVLVNIFFIVFTFLMNDYIRASFLFIIISLLALGLTQIPFLIKKKLKRQGNYKNLNNA